MIPRLILVMLILLLQLSYTDKFSEKLRYNLSFVLLFLFAALRGSGDGDYFAYLRYSRLITSLEHVFNSQFPMEIGFRIISYINNILGFHEQAVIATMNCISLLCVYNFIKKYSPDKMLSIILFLPLYFQFDMHAARTAVAIGVSTLGFKYLCERDVFRYILIVFFASFFHKTALILIPTYFLVNIKINKYISIATITFTAFLSSVFSISKIVLRLLQILNFDALANRFAIYIKSDTYGYPFKIYDPRVLLLICIFILCILILERSNKIENILINYTWLNIIFIFIFREQTFFVTRLTSYINIFTLITIPVIISKYRELCTGKKQFLYKLATIGIYLMYISRFILTNTQYKLFFT